MNQPEIRIRANPANHTVDIAMFRDDQWWSATVVLSAAAAPDGWARLQPDVTLDQARKVIGQLYDHLQPDAFADRMDSAQDALARRALDAMADAGINVAEAAT